MRQGLFLLAALLAGCQLFKPPPDDRNLLYFEPSTPENVIRNLQIAYQTRDLDAYLSCLDPDSFRFYFDPADTGIDQLLRERWGLDSLVWGFSQEELSARALFDSVRSISLFLTGGQYLEPPREDRAVLLYEYSLSIEPTPPGVEEIAGRARFTLKRRPNGYWYILRWEDRMF